LSRSVEPLARHRPVIIDESDGELSSFPAALELGYTGVSSKNCKGFYKSILNAARVARLGAGHFMSAEDLTTWPGVSVQQDLALVSLLGLTMSSATPITSSTAWASRRSRAAAFVAAHPDLYEKKDGKPRRLKAVGGKLRWARSTCRALRSAPRWTSSRLPPMAKELRHGHLPAPFRRRRSRRGLHDGSRPTR
jgi:hypothetical protein